MSKLAVGGSTAGPDEDGGGVAVPHGGWGRVGADGDGLGRAEFQALAKVAMHDEFVHSLATWSGEGELGREERVERVGEWARAAPFQGF